MVTSASIFTDDKKDQKGVAQRNIKYIVMNVKLNFSQEEEVYKDHSIMNLQLLVHPK